jgi:hypothetical protein
MINTLFPSNQEQFKYLDLNVKEKCNVFHSYSNTASAMDMAIHNLFSNMILGKTFFDNGFFTKALENNLFYKCI